MATSMAGSESSEDDWRKILTGYRVCAVEAIRYLTEEEKLPLDHPLVVGLWQHLMIQEAQLDFQEILNSIGDDSGVSMAEESESEDENVTPIGRLTRSSDSSPHL